MNISGIPLAMALVVRTLKKLSLKQKKMFESNLNSFLDMLFKETHPILSIIFIWKKNKKTSTLSWMLKKGHKISKALTIAILFGWSLAEAIFKCSSRAHWKAVKGRMRPKTSNKHLYMKKKGGLFEESLKKGKSSFPQA